MINKRHFDTQEGTTEFAWKRVWMTPYLGVDALKVKQDAFGASWNDMDAFE